MRVLLGVLGYVSFTAAFCPVPVTCWSSLSSSSEGASSRSTQQSATSGIQGHHGAPPISRGRRASAGATGVLAQGEGKGMAEGSTLATVQAQDEEVWSIIMDERRRQVTGIELIASENFASRAVLEALGSVMTNKYSEGRPGARYYGGNEHVDRIERLCEKRALDLFGLSSTEWGVNVQPYSGSPANFAVYTGLLKPHDRYGDGLELLLVMASNENALPTFDQVVFSHIRIIRIMGLDLPSGGHLTHGYYNDARKVSATSIFFESLPYRVDPTTGLIDYDDLERLATLFRPKLLIAGASAYPRDWDYKRMREIADKCEALLMTDMAHISGLVAAGEANDPFVYSHVVTSTTHKSLRGPRSGMIFYRIEFKEAIDFAVFPSLQGGPHNHQITALAVALKEAASPDFKDYIKQVKRNAVALAEGLKQRGHRVVTDGTENHLVLWDVRPHSVTGSKVERLLERCGVSVNKNTIHGDKSAAAPGGVRVGTPAMTTRGMKEADFDAVACILDRGLRLAVQVQSKAKSRRLTDFEAALDDGSHHEELQALAKDVEALASKLPFPS